MRQGMSSHTNHTFSQKKNPASKDILNFLTMSSKNQMEQFLKALAKGSKLFNFCVINPSSCFGNCILQQVKQHIKKQLKNKGLN